jgi:hypothetical protein
VVAAAEMLVYACTPAGVRVAKTLKAAPARRQPHVRLRCHFDGLETLAVILAAHACHCHPVSACRREGRCTASSLPGSQPSSLRYSFLLAYKR